MADAASPRPSLAEPEGEVTETDINGVPWDASWEVACMRYRGRVLRGRLAHYCPDWDGLPTDEGDEEMQFCTCMLEPQWFGNWSA